jgi:catechol 2,3-dioxygenase-like lactoylglutathione lyase family enzyme
MEVTMSAKVTGLGHIGIYAHDIPKMIDFYTEVLGMTLTDRGNGDRGVFLSARPEQEHHEFVLAQAPEGEKTLAQQISFTVGSLADLKELHGRITAAGCNVDRIVNHGIAFGCYFRDPEDNRIEVYWSTGKDYPQPHGDPIDITRPESELLDILANMPPKEANKPHMYGEDVGKRLVSSN